MITKCEYFFSYILILNKSNVQIQNSSGAPDEWPDEKKDLSVLIRSFTKAFFISINFIQFLDGFPR